MSGRSWLVGCWADGEAVTATIGTTRLAAIGPCSLTPDGLAARGTASDGMAGSFHLLASYDGRIYARGTNSGVRRLYTAHVDGLTVAADRAHTLAWLTGAEPDPARLALRMLLPEPPHPFQSTGMWRNIEAVRPGHALRIHPDGSSHTKRWWQTPSPELPLEKAAPLLRDTLRKAIALRVRPGEVWGADLSGGMDSTSLCFLAHEAGARLVAATLEWSAVGNEDAAYAREAARHLPGIVHLTIPTHEIAGHFAGIESRRPPGDEPSELVRSRAQQADLLARLLEHGARSRFCGHGGDHVVIPPPAYLHRFLRGHPLAGLRHVAAHRAAKRWPLAGLLRELASRRTLADWLTAQSETLGSVQRREWPMCDWGPRLSLPPWSTPQARELAAGQLRIAAAECEPLGPDRGSHTWVYAARAAGTLATHVTEWSERLGLPTEMPFCDDAVLDATLRVRPQDIGHPTVYKPLLATAMDGIVPATILERTTKDHCDTEWYAGITAQRRTLAAWADDSRLVATGLADPASLRRAVLAPTLLTGGVGELESTLGVEEWLRDLEAHPHPHYLKEHAHDLAPAGPEDPAAP
ncbi:asparagine synthase-related protein [Streptomyces mayteni]